MQLPGTRFSRPTRVTTVGCLLLGNAVIEALTWFLHVYFPKPQVGDVVYPHSLAVIHLAHAVVLVFCGWFLLKGTKWARIAYFIVCAASLADILMLGLNASLLKTELEAPILRILIGVPALLTPRANKFFAGLDPDRSYAKPTISPLAKGKQQKEGKYDY